MAKVSNFDTGNVDAATFQRYSTKQMQDIVNVLNKGVLFADNFDAQIIDVVFSAANTSTAVTHNLQRTALGYYPLKLSAAAIIYDGSGSNTQNEISLKASAACTAKVLIF